MAKKNTFFQIWEFDPKNYKRIKLLFTGGSSSMTLEQARAKVDYSKNQAIYETDGVSILWEIC